MQINWYHVFEGVVAHTIVFLIFGAFWLFVYRAHMKAIGEAPPAFSGLYSGYGSDTKIFHVAGRCIDGDCDCHLYDGKVMDAMEVVPRHKDCDCYAIRVKDAE